MKLYDKVLHKTSATLFRTSPAQAQQKDSFVYNVQCSIVHCSVLVYSAVNCSALVCSVVQCSAVQCSAVQCTGVQCSVAWRAGE